MDRSRARHKCFSVFKQPAYRIDGYLNKEKNIHLNVEDIRLLLDYIKKFIKNAYKSIGSIKIIFVIDYNKIVDDKFINDDEIFKKILNLSIKNECFHYIDIYGNYIETIKIEEYNCKNIFFDQDYIEINDISYFSEIIDSTVIYSENIIYEINHSGRMIEKGNFIGSDMVYGKLNKNMKSISNYKELIDDHYNECIKYASETDHWSNKSQRMLRDSSEDIFKKSLWYYLHKFSLDAVIDVEYNLPSGNRIDIVAKSDKNKLYIFEVKVLGKYQSNKKNSEMETRVNEYGEDRVHHGMTQIKCYLDEMDNVCRATLIVYDGRKFNKGIMLSSEEMHEKLDEPMYLYLESESATEKARNSLRKKKA